MSHLYPTKGRLYFKIVINQALCVSIPSLIELWIVDYGSRNLIAQYCV